MARTTIAAGSSAPRSATARPSLLNPRASDANDITGVGAPQPSTPVWVISVSQYCSNTRIASDCTSASGSKYWAGSAPAATVAAKDPACLPEQLCASRDRSNGIGACCNAAAATCDADDGNTAGQARPSTFKPASI